ncbi:pyridoxal phosphate-dependent aminotransferase [Fusibacter sp. 3D3]|uniref:pyridoxal phosphate-dependent aminotransferase n=1 Tax=Fusibacter sp. 3D3 TaxID=1048380 RepID=UPI000853D06C|nr:pyridoxal phosphate-dependent aminotransferase [Fusibacter sp. 3D3]GAU76860.1 aspartate aminotransferase [Fusibacter sp. 3D3]
MNLSQKIKTITPSYTIGISTKVKALKSEGKSIIDLSIGEPDFFTPEKAKLEGIDAIARNESKYDMVPGLMALRKAIVQKLKTENNVSYDVADIVVSSGAKHAITNTLLATLDPGDEVIVPKPYWTSYPEMIKLCGGVPVLVDTQIENQFKLTIDELKSAITPKTKMLLINNPSNPTGAVYTMAELEPLVNLCIEKELFILADEIYERICYTDTFTSIPTLSPEAKAITILVNGLSKSVAMTGWRIGYTASSPEIAKAISTIQGHLVSHPSIVSQWAGAVALTDCLDDMSAMVSEYKLRRDLLVERLQKIKNVTFIQPDGAFYLFIDLSYFKDKFEAERSVSLKIGDDLLLQYNLAVVPGIAFGNDHCIRLSYATELSLVQEGLNRIETYLNQL